MSYCIDDFDLIQADEYEYAYDDYEEDFVDYPRKSSGHFSYDYYTNHNFEDIYSNYPCDNYKR